MAMTHTTLDDWIRDEVVSFSLESPETFDAAVDRVVASLGDPVELLGFGEALHGGEEILLLRNRLFRRLVEKHGYSAIAIENSFPWGRVVNDYVAGRGPASYEVVRETGFSHGFGRLEANRELVEWMREYNADPSRQVTLRFYGFDIPVLQAGITGPREVLYFVLDYLASIDSAAGERHREEIDALLAPDADWENPAAMADPAKSIGRSPAATALRIATEDLITELRIRRPELAAKTGEDRYREAMQYAKVARELLNYHATWAQPSEDRYGRPLGIRGALMADNLAYITERERGRGRVLAFAHNSHLQRGRAVWPWYAWWPAGSHLAAIFGPRYAVIGSAVGTSDANGIGEPGPGTLEARLTAVPGTGLFIPTHGSEGLPAAEIASLPARTGSAKNPSYQPLGPRSFTDFDWLAFLDRTGYSRGGPPLP